jgi:hypothetical protein
LYIFFLSPIRWICPSFWVRKIIIFEFLAENHIFHKCVPVTSGICRISTKIENKKKKLVPSFYGFGESYKHIFFLILAIFKEIQKMYRQIQSCTSLARMSLQGLFSYPPLPFSSSSCCTLIAGRCFHRILVTYYNIYTKYCFTSIYYNFDPLCLNVLKNVKSTMNLNKNIFFESCTC